MAHGPFLKQGGVFMGPTLPEVLPWPEIRLRLRSVEWVPKVVPPPLYLSLFWLGHMRSMPQPPAATADTTDISALIGGGGERVIGA